MRLVLNTAAKEELEQKDREILQDEFRIFVQQSPEVRAMMLERASAAISSMSNWDICYHGRIQEAAAEALKNPELRDALQSAILRVLKDDGNLNYQVIQAVGECLAGRITMKLPE